MIHIRGMISPDSPPPDWDALERAVLDEGFAADACRHFRDPIINALGPWHEGAHRLNRLAMSQYRTASEMLGGRQLSDPVARGIQMFPRCLSSFQAALVLIERGAGQDALLHVRSIYECVFWIAFLAADPKRAEAQLQLKAYNSSRKRFQQILDHGDAFADDTKAVALSKIREMGDRPKGLREMELVNIALAGGCAFEYAHYLDLSETAAHATLSSTRPFLARDAQGQFSGHQYGPDIRAIDKALKLAAHAMFVAIAKLQLITGLKVDPAENLAINAIFNSAAR